MRLSLLLMLSLAIASCAGPSSSPKSREQTLRANLYTEPPSLDPRKTTDATSVNVLINIYDGLMRFGSDHHPHPAVAERVMLSDDQKTYTFSLGERFWSNGTPVRAQDFLYAWETVLEPLFPAPFAYKLFVIKNARLVKEGNLPKEELGVRCLDEKTLEVTLEHPTPYFCELITFPTYFPVPEGIDQQCEQWAAEAGPTYLCNGPFEMVKWDHENEIILARNPWYHEEIPLDQVVLTMIDDTMTEFYMYEMNELDWAGSPLSNLPTEIIPSLKEAGALQTYPATAIYYYKLNTKEFPLNHQKVRRAMALAMDRQKIVDHIMQAGQLSALGLIPNMPDGRASIAYFQDADVAGAQKLFAEALEELGLTKETFPSIKLCFNSNREHQKVAQAVQHQWQEVLGVKTELEACDWGVYLSKVDTMDYQIARMGWIGDFNDPISFLAPFKDPDEPINATGWSHPEYSRLLDLSCTLTDDAARTVALQQAEELLISEMPIIPMFYITLGYLKKPYVQGIYLSPLGTIDFKGAWIDL